MSRWAGLLLIFAVAQIGCAFAGGSGDIAALISAAQGTHPASQLPIMCVAVHRSTASPMQNIALLQKTGARCARADNVWSSIERAGSAGSYDWSESDDLWITLCKAGIKPIMLATYNNPIYAARVFAPIVGGVNVTAFKNFAVAMANHYISACSDMVEELFNEPSALNWTTVPWTGASYAAMLAPVSAAIKAAQPRVTIYSGGVGFEPGPEATVWIKQMVGAEKFPAVDAYAFHPYNYDQYKPSATLPPEQLLIDARLFTDATASTGQGKPVALTEYGFPLQALGGDLTKQGVYVARGMLAAIIGHYGLSTHYDLIDDGTDEADRENTFGLFRNGSYKVPYEMKPAGLAFAAITSAMARATAYTIGFDPAISAPTLSFDKAEGKTFVIWTYDTAGPKSYSQPIGRFKRVDCKDIFGKSYACLYADEVLSMSLSESRGPIIVTAQK